MPSKKVNVAVFEHGLIVGTLTARPVRVMPNGRAGVVCDGVVYPLYTGNVIVLENEPVDRNAIASSPAHSQIPYATFLDAESVGEDDDIDPEEKALRILEQALRELRVAEDDDVDVEVEDEESGENEVRRELLTDLVITLSSRPLDADVTARIASFEGDANVGGGYLAGRYHEVCTRPGHEVEDSVEGQLAAMATLVRDEKALLTRLSSQHGPFLESRPHLAERALNAELDKVDTDASWRSPDDTLRRCRASLTYLRHATVLSFGTDDGISMLRPVLEKLMQPAVVRVGDVPRNVTAAASNLHRMIDLVNELIGVDDPDELPRGDAKNSWRYRTASSTVSPIYPTYPSGRISPSWVTFRSKCSRRASQ